MLHFDIFDWKAWQNTIIADKTESEEKKPLTFQS